MPAVGRGGTCKRDSGGPASGSPGNVYDKQSFRSVRDGVEKGHTGQRNRGEAEACADGGQEPALA